MSDSVGKISLDLEVKSDLSKQIGDVSAELGKKLESTFTNSTKGIFDGVNESIEANMKSINNVIKVALEQMQANVKASVNALMELTNGIKTPTPSSTPQNVPIPSTPNVITPSIPRAPPMPVTPTMPKNPKITLNTEEIKAKIDSLTRTIDLVNEKIELQQNKLAKLKESYNRAFSESTKNKLAEQILNTEMRISSLISRSDRLGFALADLDSKFQILNEAENRKGQSLSEAAKGIELFNEEAEVMARGAAATNKNTKAVQGKGQALNNAAGKLGSFSSKLSKALVPLSKVSSQLKNIGIGSKSAENGMRHMNYGLSMIMRQFFTWMVVLPLLMRGLTAMTTFLGQAFMTNSQFANSLAQIRSNLYTAFMPIFEAVLPAINSLMSGLATITAYIASFTSALFGKTYNQSFGAAKGLIAAKVAMGAYGEAAKKAGKDAKGALAGFDEINVLNMGKDADGGAGAGSDKVPQMVAPGMDTSALDSSTKMWVDKFKAVLNTIFKPLKNAWAKDGAGVMTEFKIAVGETKGTLKNFYDMLATPPVQLFIENVARIGLALAKLALKIYDSFILPIVNWFISILPGAADGFNPILEAVRNFIDYLSGDGFKYVRLFISTLIGGFVAIKAIGITLQIIEVVSAIGELGAAIVASPLSLLILQIGLVVAAIAGLIAIFATLYASNEDFRNKVNEVGKAIGDFLKPMFEQLKNVLVDLWNNVMVPIGNFLINVFAIAFNVVANVAKDLCNLVLKPLADFLLSTFIKVIQGVIDIWKAWEPAINIVMDALLLATKFTGGVFIEVFRGVFTSIGEIIGDVKKIFGGLIDFIAGVFTGDWKRAWQGIKDVFSGIFGGLGDILKAPLNAIIGMINGAIRNINSLSFDIPDWIPGIGGKHFGSSLNKIPYLARGGVVDSPTLAMVGEAGKEAVMPLENNTGWINNLAGQISAQLGNSGINNNSEIVDLLKQILKALKEQSGDLVLRVSESDFARIAINAINNRTRQSGFCELKV